MFAVIAAIMFGLALLLVWIKENLGEIITPTTLLYGGLLFLALHLAGVGTGWGWRRSYRGRRPGPG
ncbi:MAG TPA: hypothetical protein VFB84_06545 [Micromonosporaceae bacterium]|nr:hypothetical protein [Micromonosporaceae bacterium]